MNRITCLVTDDEPFARKGLEGYIKKIDFLDLRGLCEDAVQLNSFLKKEPIDLIFLDIEMPYLSGIDFLKGLSAIPKVIFTTAYEKYALQGFDLDVLDYLVKPIPYERFLKAANKAYDYFELVRNREDIPENYLFVRVDYKLEKIVFEEIEFIQGLQNYVTIYLRGRSIVTHSTLKNIASRLPAGKFCQPHKSFLVSIEKIQSIQGNTIKIGEHEIPISKYQREEVLEKIINNKLLNN